MRKTDIWHRIDYLREEGTFTGTVEKAEITTGGDGCKLIVRLRPPKKDFALPAGGMPQKLYNHLFQDDIMADGCVKIGVFRSGWKYCQDPDVNDEWTETSIDTLIYHLRPGHRITFRMSKNWRRDRYYCRYIHNHNTGEWSGYETESDWRQAAHPYTMLPEKIKYITIKHADRIETDYGYDLSLEVSPQDDKWMIYRTYAQSGTDAYIQLDELIDVNVKVEVSVDPETGRSYITEIDLGELMPKKKKKLSSSQMPRRRTPAMPYIEQAKIAAAYPEIDIKEYEKTNGVYYGTIADCDLIDYSAGRQVFFPIKLDDGRTIMPRFKVNPGKIEKKILETEIYKTDLMRNKKLLFPGVRVKLIFTKSQKSERMVLRGVLSNVDAETLENEKKKFLEKYKQPFAV